MVRSRPRRHVGRPRDPALDRAILDATLAELREQGYGGFTLESVAARARTTKPTITRRWRRRQELIIAALATVVVHPAVPDTGCSRCDLIEGVELLADAVLRRMPPGVLAPLVAECSSDERLRDRLNSDLLGPPRRALSSTVRRALERGDLVPDTDPELVVELLASVVFQSSYFLESRFDVRRAAEAVDVVLRGIAVDFDALVELGETPTGQPHRHEG